MRKRILKHAFVILNAAFFLGLVTGFAHGQHRPSAKAWLIAHVTGIMVATLIAVVGLLWDDLRLGPRAARVLYWSTVPANYAVMVILGVLGPALGSYPSLVIPDAPPVAAGVQALVTSGIILATVSSFAMASLVLYGLRAGGEARALG